MSQTGDLHTSGGPGPRDRVGEQGRVDHDADVHLVTRPPSIPREFVRAVTSRKQPASTDLPDRRLVMTDVEQDIDRLRDYCELTGSVLSDRLPATWLHVLTFPLQVTLMASADFPFPMLGMVHIANSMTQHRPVLVTEKLTLMTWAENLAPHRRGQTVDLMGQVRVGAETVWEGRSTYLIRGKAAADGSVADDAAADGAVGDADPRVSTSPVDGEGALSVDGGEPADYGVPGGAASSELAAGEVPSNAGLPQIAQWRVPANLGRRYAAIAGDANPIHLAALPAKAFGFKRAIAHGMWTHARMLSAVQARLPRAFTVDVDFRKPILLPSTVVLRGELGGGGDGARHMELAMTSRDGSRTHVEATVSGRS